jgi:predicted acetyltransferase
MTRDRDPDHHPGALPFGPPTGEAEITALGELLSHAFGFPPGDYKAWFERAKIDNLRVVKRGGRVCAGLLEIPMGQYFGGRPVSTMGVAGVGVVPEERGRGVAAQMMVAMLREARARGFALSTLYPASVTLYRRAGYERAGARFTLSLDPRMCEIERVPEVTVTEVDGAPAELMALYSAWARRKHGYLDRGPYVWSRVTRPRNLAPKVFAVSHRGGLEGYVAAAHVATDPPKPTFLQVTDMAATTSRAARAILRLLVEYRSLCGSVRWGGGPSDLFANLLPERYVAMELESCWMVRVLDLARAFTMRGWPDGATGSLGFELTDASMPENSGHYTVSLDRGKAVVTSGDAPRSVVISERGLAALYTGHVAPRVLADLGWLEADDEACDRLEAWFGGSMPMMCDHF